MYHGFKAMVPHGRRIFLQQGLLQSKTKFVGNHALSDIIKKEQFCKIHTIYGIFSKLKLDYRLIISLDHSGLAHTFFLDANSPCKDLLLPQTTQTSLRNLRQCPG